jgi:hypothetical protein
VTKKSATRFSYLDLLSRFLNFDFGSGDARKLKKFFRDSLVVMDIRFPPNQKQSGCKPNSSSNYFRLSRRQTNQTLSKPKKDFLG